jgi:hypothetical protein
MRIHTFDLDKLELRSLRHILTHVGASTEIQCEYFSDPSPKLLRKLKDAGMKIEEQERIGRFKVTRIS